MKILGKGMYGINRKGWKKMVIKGNGSYLLRERDGIEGRARKGIQLFITKFFDSALILSSL